MPDHQQLDNITHKDLRIIISHHPDYGDNVSYTNVFVSEFRTVQAHYPIFLRKHTDSSQFEAVSLFGFAEQENLFLDAQGWHADYIPLTIRRRPFLIGFQNVQDQGMLKKEPVVHVDMDSPRVSNIEGEPVFLSQGGQSPLLQEVSSILKEIHLGHEQTNSFINTLLEHDLVESISVKVTLNDGKSHELTNLYSVNEEKVNALEGKLLQEFHTKGYVFLIHMMLASMANLTTLINKKNQLL